tara:strand:+ start:196 stop:402 length:207 start_codon:yes stop_codon:yes gene_type:complete
MLESAVEFPFPPALLVNSFAVDLPDWPADPNSDWMAKAPCPFKLDIDCKSLFVDELVITLPSSILCSI